MSAKVVVITGASGGIGASLAEALAKQGMSLVLVARRKTELSAVAKRCKGSHAIVADAEVRAEVKRVVADAIAQFGHIDVWVNNVGRGITQPPSKLTDDDIDAMMRVNVKSAMYGMQEVLPHFKERGAGHIINMSSQLGRVSYAVNRSAYGAAKFFLNAITDMFRSEVQSTHPGIQVSLVSPGAVVTEFGKNAVHGGPDSRTLPDGQSPQEVADVIAMVIHSRKPDVYTRKGMQARIAAHYSSLGSDP